MTKPATTKLAGTFEVRSWTEEEWPAAGEAVAHDDSSAAMRPNQARTTAW